jgi:hypothetical protein
MKRATLAGLVLLLAACGETRDGDSPFGSAGITAGETAGGGTDDAAGGTGDSDGGSAGPGAGSDGSDPVLDVGYGGDVGSGSCVGDEDCSGCTAVDLLFVIDNSGSMGDYQNALALAFPQFAQTLVESLPAGTNVHVGVTSTEMGYSSMGSTSINNGSCEFVGDNNQKNDAFYVPPSQSPSGRNGAQGRLYDPGGGQTYFEFSTNAGPAALSELEAWFSAAANIGEGGSNIEMSTAPVGWVADPANDSTNLGFIRDAGAVLVVFFVQDEPDQTPLTIEGVPGGQAMLDRLVEAKSECGGVECIVAGGFLNANACSATGNLPLDDFLAGVGSTPVVSPLPAEGLAEGNPQAAAAEMNELLSVTLADVISQTCDSIPPEG